MMINALKLGRKRVPAAARCVCWREQPEDTYVSYNTYLCVVSCKYGCTTIRYLLYVEYLGRNPIPETGGKACTTLTFHASLE
jgi:hypothetical protein